MSERKGVELKKYAARQNKDGWVISFVVHPDDWDSDIIKAKPGTVFMCGFQELNDEGLPDMEDVRGILKEHKPQAPKPKRTFEEMTRTEQAGTLCGDPMFRLFMSDDSSAEECAKQKIYHECEITSRAQLNEPDRSYAHQAWDDLVRQFRNWQKTDARYADELSRQSNERAVR